MILTRGLANHCHVHSQCARRGLELSCNLGVVLGEPQVLVGCVDDTADCLKSTTKQCWGWIHWHICGDRTLLAASTGICRITAKHSNIDSVLNKMQNNKLKHDDVLVCIRTNSLQRCLHIKHRILYHNATRLKSCVSFQMVRGATLCWKEFYRTTWQLLESVQGFCGE